MASKGQPTTLALSLKKKEGAKKKPRGMGEKRMRVRSEGITMRNKAGKLTRLGSRRRPVSVDGDIAYNTGDQRVEQSAVGDKSPRELIATGVEQGAEMFIPSPSQPGQLSFVHV